MFLMRVTLPGPPRFVGLRCDGDGSVDADINAVEIVEKKFDGSVVDDFIVDLPPNQLPETIVTACQSLPGVRVEWIARYPEGGGLQSDLEALERMTADPPHAAGNACLAMPRCLSFSLGDLDRRIGWRASSQLRDHPGTDLTPEIADSSHHSTRPTAPIWMRAGVPAGATLTAVVTPLTRDRVIVIGRLGGPAFLDSEIARLHHLAALVK